MDYLFLAVDDRILRARRNLGSGGWDIDTHETKEGNRTQTFILDKEFAYLISLMLGGEYVEVPSKDKQTLEEVDWGKASPIPIPVKLGEIIAEEAISP